jgi:hypothetical protein
VGVGVLRPFCVTVLLVAFAHATGFFGFQILGHPTRDSARESARERGRERESRATTPSSRFPAVATHSHPSLKSSIVCRSLPVTTAIQTMLREPEMQYPMNAEAYADVRYVRCVSTLRLAAVRPHTI